MSRSKQEWINDFVDVHFNLSAGENEHNRFYKQFGVYFEEFAVPPIQDIAARIAQAKRDAESFYEGYLKNPTFEQNFEESFLSADTFCSLCISWPLFVPKVIMDECQTRDTRETLYPIVVDTIDNLTDRNSVECQKFHYHVAKSCIKRHEETNGTLGEYYAKKLDNLSYNKLFGLFCVLDLKIEGHGISFVANEKFVTQMRDILWLEIEPND